MKEPEMESIRWFEQAKYDLKAARWNAKGDLFAPACFWAQQAAEKATKAFIYSKGERFVIGHSVAELLKKCQKYDKGFKPLLTIGGFWIVFTFQPDIQMVFQEGSQPSLTTVKIQLKQ